MRILLPTILFACLAVVSCSKTTSVTPANVGPSPSPTIRTASGQSTSEPKDGDYKGSGKITKINTDLGSVELDHGDIPGLMPAMQMEFYVSDKGLMKGLKVGDVVDFTILYKGGTETVTSLSRAE